MKYKTINLKRIFATRNLKHKIGDVSVFSELESVLNAFIYPIFLEIIYYYCQASYGRKELWMGWLRGLQIMIFKKIIRLLIFW